MIDAMNGEGVPIIAVDLPSGINGTSGAIMGAAVNATRTVTFFRRKTGHLLFPGRLHCGAVEVVDIGIPESVLERSNHGHLPMARILVRFVSEPGLQAHKYTRGHVVVVSGGASTPVQPVWRRAALCGRARVW